MTSEARTTTAEGRSVSQMLWIWEDTLKRPSDERSEDYDGEAGVCLRWHRGSGNSGGVMQLVPDTMRLTAEFAKIGHVYPPRT